MTTWAKVKPGERVELKGKPYVVAKIKAKGKRAKVTVVGAAGRFTSEVKLKDEVKRVKRGKLYDRDGRMQRWAEPDEVKHAARVAGQGLPDAGDPAVTEPPRKKFGNPWETPRDKVERKLTELMGARLVGEADDETSGWYVPPVDVTTIAGHLALFHGTDTSSYGIDDMRELHELEHQQALSGVALHVNHWHTEERPSV